MVHPTNQSRGHPEIKTEQGNKRQIEEGRSDFAVKISKKIPPKKRKFQSGGFCKVPFRRSQSLDIIRYLLMPWDSQRA
jgi:hypothetical protein